jgi:ubiquitin-protein ligase
LFNVVPLDILNTGTERNFGLRPPLKVDRQSFHKLTSFLFGEMLIARLQQELAGIEANPLPNWLVRQADDVGDCPHWIGTVNGPPYPGQQYHVHIHFTSDYPDVPPQIRLDPLIKHQLVCYGTGEICLEPWMDNWPSIDPVRTLLQGISDLLNNPEKFSWPDDIVYGDVIDSSDLFE